MKFYRFKRSASLVSVKCTESFCILFFSKIVLVLRKSSLVKIREIPGSFTGALELDFNLLLFSVLTHEIVRFSMIENSRHSFYLPMEHDLLTVDVCSVKKFVVAITRHRNAPRTNSVVFWTWSNSQFLYIFDEKRSIQAIKIIDDTRLLVFGKSVLKVFDNNKIEFTGSMYFEGALQDVHYYGKDLLLLHFKNGSFFLANLVTNDQRRIAPYGKKVRLVYMADIRTMWELTDITNCCKVML